MKKNYGCILAALILLTACGQKKEDSVTTVRPVKTARVESRSEIRKDFSGIVEAVDYVKLAFRVSGQIINLPVVEGQRVKKGQLIAAIDPRDLALQYAADKSAYETAAAQVERNKRLLARQAISVQEYEISVSTFQQKKSAYELSSNNMRDTRLTAPFDGSIDQIEFIGEVYDSARVGLVVPQYVTIDSIGELAAHKGQFSSEIVGIDAGAGIMKTTDKAIGDYGLDGYKLLTSSSSTMLASLQKAMEKEAWIVITGWTPHWMFDRYPLKFLHDPKGTYGNVESIYVVGWKGFTEKDPFAAKFFSNIKFTTEEISSLMKALKDARMDEEDLVRKWRDEHRELVESWIPES